MDTGVAPTSGTSDRYTESRYRYRGLPNENRNASSIHSLRKRISIRSPSFQLRPGMDTDPIPNGGTSDFSSSSLPPFTLPWIDSDPNPVCRKRFSKSISSTSPSSGHLRCLPARATTGEYAFFMLWYSGFSRPHESRTPQPHPLPENRCHASCCVSTPFQMAPPSAPSDR